MADHIVFAHGGGIACPYLVALERAQRSHLVSMGLRDPGYTGEHARTHHHMAFNVQPSTYQIGDRILDETTPDGDDWAWIAKHQRDIKGSLGRDHGVSRATAYRYVNEVIGVLADQAPDLHEALEQAKKQDL